MLNEDTSRAPVLYESIQDWTFDVETLQDEMNWQLDLLICEQKRIKQLEDQIHTIYTQIDPHGLLISLPGIAYILAAAILTCTGSVNQFPSLCKHRGFARLYPTQKSTGDQTTSHGKISKQSHNRYKRTLYLTAENAHKSDVELCAFYHKRRQHTHTEAVCAVANAKLIPGIHLMLKAMNTVRNKGHEPPHYVYRDEARHPISISRIRPLGPWCLHLGRYG